MLILKEPGFLDRFDTIARSYSLECNCKNPEHILRFGHFLGNKNSLLHVEIILNPYRGPFGIIKRMWYAIQYFFGIPGDFGRFDETVLGEEQVRDLRMLCDFVLEKLNE